MAGEITQAQIDQAKALGYSDAQIEEYLGAASQETNLPKPSEQKTDEAGMFRTPTVGSAAPVSPSEQPWVDRSSEKAALAVGGGALAAGGAAKLGAEYLLARKAIEKAGQAFRGTPTAGAPAPAPGPQIQVPPNTGGVPRPQPNIGTPQQIMDTLRQPAPGAPAGTPMPEAAPGAQARPTVGGPAAAEGSTFIQRMAALAGKYAPAARLATGAGLMAYSPGLNAGEDEEVRRMREQQDQQRAQGLIR